MNLQRLGDLDRAKKEFTEGISLAEAIGERRVLSLLKGNYATLLAEEALQIGSDTPAGQQLLDEALQTALENREAGEATGLLYSQFEGRRCLAEVRFRRGELAEAETICAAAADLVSGTESRVSQLWLGPLYIEILKARAQQFEKQNQSAEAAERGRTARELLEKYQQLVAQCETPRFTREAERLQREFGS